jgi:hypothetical protein
MRVKLHRGRSDPLRSSSGIAECAKRHVVNGFLDGVEYWRAETACAAGNAAGLKCFRRIASSSSAVINMTGKRRSRRLQLAPHSIPDNPPKAEYPGRQSVGVTSSLARNSSAEVQSEVVHLCASKGLRRPSACSIVITTATIVRRFCIKSTPQRQAR